MQLNVSCTPQTANLNYVSKKKLLQRLFSKPKDFTWDELRALLKGLGYEEISGEGSRYKFQHPKTHRLISLHKPHPGNMAKEYLIKNIIEVLKEEFSHEE